MSTTQGDTSNEHYSSDVAELQKTLKDALAKNQQWLAYNQQREAYVRTVVDRMLWLDNQLDQAVRAQLTQHNKEHSEDERMREMKEHFESLLVIGRDNLLIVKQRLDVTLQDLAETKNRVEEKEMEASDLKQQLRRCSKDKELLMNEIKVLRGRLGVEKQRSAKLERQRMQQKEDYEVEEEEDEEPVYEEMRSCRPSSESIFDASTLHCPVCRIQCPVSQYRQMMDHLEVCMN
ncbi:centrosomal protein of 55 kDa-like isoform X2 [Hippocampus zosterae]|uniref:centrosomal protein of 55 kDa-like isoform X2 n=1 Tax=Hippocampus zosterae TaxID=109293 RepID=UPI00223DEF48|nr:centrosomal protein of 55 kDa-like isoform X2 [Hippocampus zosterae]